MMRDHSFRLSSGHAGCRDGRGGLGVDGPRRLLEAVLLVGALVVAGGDASRVCADDPLETLDRDLLEALEEKPAKDSPLQIILLLVVFYLILGCFMETLSMMIATIPVVFPLIAHMGIDPVWFGIFMVLIMEIGLITPPIGMNLYVVQGVRSQGSIMDVIHGSLPFVLLMLAFIGVLVLWPQMALWLPQKLF